MDYYRIKELVSDNFPFLIFINLERSDSVKILKRRIMLFFRITHIVILLSKRNFKFDSKEHEYIYDMIVEGIDRELTDKQVGNIVINKHKLVSYVRLGRRPRNEF